MKTDVHYAGDAIKEERERLNLICSYIETLPITTEQRNVLTSEVSTIYVNMQCVCADIADGIADMADAKVIDAGAVIIELEALEDELAAMRADTEPMSHVDYRNNIASVHSGVHRLIERIERATAAAF